jgi:hypothetical protein
LLWGLRRRFVPPHAVVQRRGPLELPPAALDVPVHGLEAETQLVGDRAAASALGDEQHDLLLDGGQFGNDQVEDLLALTPPGCDSPLTRR